MSIPLRKIPITCLQCGVDTRNPKFCSIRCAATYNNHHMPKRKKTEKFCSGCGRSSKHTTKQCKFCKPPKKNYGILTLAEVKQISGSRNSYDTIVRQHSRSVANRNEMLNRCAECGYANCVECCHIKAVSEFPITATLSEVNHKDNLIGLCPNHHWELDHGLLTLVPAEGIKPPSLSCKGSSLSLT